MSITEFLLARIEEDEARAHVAERWADDGSEPHIRWVGQGRDSLVHRLGKAGPHIATMSPVRVLAECAAKRAIMEAHPVTIQLWWEEQCEIEVCETCQEDSYPDRWPCPTVMALAAVYASHPDYQQEWAP